MDKPSKIDVSSLTNVPETMLIPLYFKAKETREKGIIKDDKAVEIVNKIDYDFSRMDEDSRTQTGVAVRTVIFDEIVQHLTAELIKKPVIVNLGAGLDTRQERFPDIKWYHLDLPVSIDMRRHFFNTQNSVLIEKSLLDFSWIDAIAERENILFIAEGVFMYFTEDEVRSVFKQIAEHFTSSYIAFNTAAKAAIGKKHPSVKTDEAPFKWGITSVKEIYKWKAGWKEKKIYIPFHYYKKRWDRKLRLLSILPSLKNAYIIALLQTEK